MNTKSGKGGGGRGVGYAVKYTVTPEKSLKTG